MSDRELLESLNASIAERQSVAMMTIIRSQDASQVGNKVLIWPDKPPLGRLGVPDLEDSIIADARQALESRRQRTLRYGEAGLEIYVEVLQRSPQLFIVGAGHIAVPLCQFASACDFAVTVIDDRAQYANEARFPQAERIIAAEIQETVRDLEMDADSYVVLVTRGHSLDVECLLEIIDRPLAYIGMIGSKRRVNAVFRLLEDEQGIPRRLLDQVYAPIGLPVGARTPAEIAICIMAEIINVMREGRAPSLSNTRRRQYQD